MLAIEERNNIRHLMQREIIPAIGCTEPVAVSLCVAKATEILGEIPERIDVLLSANVIKNAMGVGIPGTGMIGLPIAIALGALIGKSEHGLEVLRDLTPADVKLRIDLLSLLSTGCQLTNPIDGTRRHQTLVTLTIRALPVGAQHA